MKLLALLVILVSMTGCASALCEQFPPDYAPCAHRGSGDKQACREEIRRKISEEENECRGNVRHVVLAVSAGATGFAQGMQDYRANHPEVNCVTNYYSGVAYTHCE